MLDWDARQAAKQAGVTGQSKLAIALAEDHNMRLRALLQEFDDSYLGQSFEAFTELATKLRFSMLGESEFWLGGKAHFAAWQKDEMLLCADSYQGMVNQACLLLPSKQGGYLLDARQGLASRLENAAPEGSLNAEQCIRLLPQSQSCRLQALNLF
jgi:hypothetical protein